MSDLRQMAISIGWRVDDRALRAANQATDEYKESVEQGERSMISLGQRVSQIGTQMGDTINKSGIYLDGLGREFREVEIGAERSLRDIGFAAEGLDDKIQAISDPKISGSQAEGELKGVEVHAQSADAAIDAISDPQIDTSKAERNLKEMKNDANDLNDLFGALGGYSLGATIGGDFVSWGQAPRQLQASLMNVNENMAKDLTESAKEIFQSVVNLDEQGALNAVTSVRRHFNVVGEEATELGKDLANLSNLSGVEMGRIALDAKLAADRFGDIETPTEAFDIFTEATKRLGPALVEELLDQTEEYGKNIASMGISGNDFFGMMIKAGETNKYVMDRLGDSLFSEFYPRMEAANGELMEMLGALGGSSKQADEWRESILQGGEAGKHAFGEIVTALNELDDRAKQRSFTTIAFGEMSEEQGQDMLSVLSEIPKGIDDVGQSVKELDIVNEGQWNRMRLGIRGVRVELEEFMGGSLGEFSEALGGALPFIGAFIGAGGIGKLTKGIGGASTKVGSFNSKIGTLNSRLGFTAYSLGPQLLMLASRLTLIGTVAYVTYQNWDLMWSKMEEVGKGISDLVNKMSFDVDLPEWLGGDFKFGLPSGEGISELGGGIKSDTMGQGFKDFLKPLVPFAEGGLVTGPTLGLVGEAGEHEVIAPVSKLDSFLDNLTRQYAPPASAAMPSVHFNPVYQVSGTGQNNDQLVNDLRRRMKQDFNQLMQDWFRQQQKFFPNTIER